MTGAGTGATGAVCGGAMIGTGAIILPGARIGRKLPPIALRAVIVVVGLVAIGKLVLT